MANSGMGLAAMLSTVPASSHRGFDEVSARCGLARSLHPRGGYWVGCLQEPDHEDPRSRRRLSPESRWWPCATRPRWWPEGCAPQPAAGQRGAGQPLRDAARARRRGDRGDRETGERLLAEGVACARRRRRPRIEVARGEPRTPCSNIAEDEGCTLIVAGRMGRASEGRRLGSVAPRLVTRREPPVTVVRSAQ